MSHVLASTSANLPCFDGLANVTDHHPNPPHSAIRSWRTEDGEECGEICITKQGQTHTPVSQKRIQTDRLGTACGLYASSIRQQQAVPSGKKIDEAWA
jgi:hypothetical protein